MKYLLLPFLLCIVFAAAHAQDTLTLANGEVIICRIIKVTQKSVKYDITQGPEQPRQITELADVQSIKYADGTQRILSNPIVSNPAVAENRPTIIAPDSLYMQGRRDARKYYSSYGSAGGSTLIVTLLLGPVIGLIPAVACSSTKPKTEYLGMPPQYKDKEEYVRGYAREAKSIKSTRVWTNYGIGAVFSAIATFVILTSSDGN